MENSKETLTGYVVTDRFILRSDSIIEKQIIPLHDIDAIAGLTATLETGYIPLEELILLNCPKCDGAVYVKGDSMFPTLNNGDIVSYLETRSRKANLFFGEIYVLDFFLDDENYIVVKRLYESDNRGFYKLVSDNPYHKTVEIPRDCVRLLGKVNVRSTYFGK